MGLPKSRPTAPGGFEGSGLLFFHRDGDRPDGGKPHLVAFDAGNQAAFDLVVMALCEPSPLSFLVSLIRLPSTLSTVPT